MLENIKSFSEGQLIQKGARLRVLTKNLTDRNLRYITGKKVEAIESELRSRRFSE